MRRRRRAGPAPGRGATTGSGARARPPPWPGPPRRPDWPAGRRARPRSRAPRTRRSPPPRRRSDGPRGRRGRAPNASDARTTTTSRATLSFVPNSATTRSLAPAGCRSMTTWPTAATSEVAPGNSAAINSDTPRATAAAATPAAAASTRDVVERAETAGPSVDAEVLTASWCTGLVTFACRAPPRSPVASHPGRPPAVVALDGERHRERLRSGRRR